MVSAAPKSRRPSSRACSTPSARGVDLNTEILLASLIETVPLSKTMSEEINRLRTWSQGRTRPATGPLVPVVTEPIEARRKLEI